jgi:uncharacterized membrane protein
VIEARARQSISEENPMSSQKLHAQTGTCAITGTHHPLRELVNIDTIRPAITNRIRSDHPDIPSGALISEEEIRRYRAEYLQDLLKAESGELTEIDRQVAQSLIKQEMLSENIEADYAGQRTLGERLSDLLAQFGGSWTFLIFFAVFLAIWMTWNTRAGTDFDPYPFILLNLVLSTLAAIQAPIIMMSQRRQEEKDRLRSLNDYKVNLKAELEIRHLHEKIDHLINNQWRRLAEIQQLQLETIEENQK